MTLRDNQALYDIVERMRRTLESSGATSWSTALARALSGSTAGEILGDIGLCLLELKKEEVCSRLGLGADIDDAVEYVEAALGNPLPRARILPS